MVCTAKENRDIPNCGCWSNSNMYKDGTAKTKDGLDGTKRTRVHDTVPWSFGIEYPT
jgi:hypothetical protein